MRSHPDKRYALAFTIIGLLGLLPAFFLIHTLWGDVFTYSGFRSLALVPLLIVLALLLPGVVLLGGYIRALSPIAWPHRKSLWYATVAYNVLLAIVGLCCAVYMGVPHPLFGSIWTLALAGVASRAIGLTASRPEAAA